MSASNDNNVAEPRQVACKTADNDEIPVDLLQLSHTFNEMSDGLGLEERNEYSGVFLVKTVSTRTFKKVIDWCKEHKGEPEPVIEKHPLTQECKWFAFTEPERRFFDVPVPELLELIMAAEYLRIPRLYHYACQAIAACIRRKSPREICEVLQQDCDLGRARLKEIYEGNAWLSAVIPGARIKDHIFIPNEVLLTIFEKLSREDLERLQLVSTQFDDVIVSSSELSEQQGPLRVVAKVEFVGHSDGRSMISPLMRRGCSRKIDLWLRNGTEVTCPDCENLAKRLKFSVVQKVRLGGVRDADIPSLSLLLPVKSAWKNAIVEVAMGNFDSIEPVEFFFTELLLCKEIILCRERESFTWSVRPYTRLPAIEACNMLDIGGLTLYADRINPVDVVEWLEHELPPEKKWSEPRHMILHKAAIGGEFDELLNGLKTAFSASSNPNPYVLYIVGGYRHINFDAEFANEKTRELLTIQARPYGVCVNRKKRA